MRKIVILTLLALSAFSSCFTDEDATTSTLQEQGYTAIRLGGWSQGCHDNDHSCTEFWATGPNGANIHGAMGCTAGWGCSKTCTMRFLP